MIRTGREAHGMSGRELARDLGYSATWMRKMEAGEIKSPDPDRLYRVARRLGISYTELTRAMIGYPPRDEEIDLLEELRRINGLPDERQRAEEYRRLPADAYNELRRAAFTLVADASGAIRGE